MFKPAAEMLMARFGSRRLHALMRSDCPAAHHRVSDFGVELQPIGLIADAEGLMAKIAALREGLEIARQVEPAFAVPLIDRAGPWPDKALERGRHRRLRGPKGRFPG